MAPDTSLLSDLKDQDEVYTFISGALMPGRLGHAYLFWGPAASGTFDAALALAQGVLCAQGGCGTCDDCIRVARQTHPDLHILYPESAQGYLMDQIRVLIEDLTLAPIRAARKVYIINDAERLTDASANALLKSLEEPPDTVVFILLASSREAMLPTILSRCQTIAVHPRSADQSAELLAQELNIPTQLCRRAIGCCDSLAHAREFLASDARQASRRAALDCLDRLAEADPYAILQLAKAAVEAARAPLADLEAEQAAVREESTGFLSTTAMREIEERQKREYAACERSAIMEQLAAMCSLLRDGLTRAAGADGPAVCDDYVRAADYFATHLGLDGLPRALEAVQHAKDRIQKNVSPQLAYEAMLFEIKELIACQS